MLVAVTLTADELTWLQQLTGTMKKTLLTIKGFSDIKVDKLKDTASKCAVSTIVDCVERVVYVDNLITVSLSIPDWC